MGWRLDHLTFLVFRHQFYLVPPYSLFVNKHRSFSGFLQAILACSTGEVRFSTPSARITKPYRTGWLLSCSDKRIGPSSVTEGAVSLRGTGVWCLTSLPVVGGFPITIRLSELMGRVLLGRDSHAVLILQILSATPLGATFGNLSSIKESGRIQRGHL